MDSFYNGKFAREWPEVNPMSNMKQVLGLRFTLPARDRFAHAARQFGTMARYKVAWEQAHEKIRPSAVGERERLVSSAVSGR
jgi:hypothetical protein